MEAVRLSETSVDFYRNIQRYLSEQGTLHRHRCEDLTYNKGILYRSVTWPVLKK
jgi:hypothetical protein